MRASARALLKASRGLRAGHHGPPAWGERPYGMTYHPEAPRWETIWAKMLGAFAFTFIGIRAYQDKGVALGFRHPLDGSEHHESHGEHDEHNGDHH